MWKLLLLSVLFVRVKGACVDDDCFKFYRNELRNIKDEVRDDFDDVLRNYNVSENGLKFLIDDLNRKFAEADDKTKNFDEKVETIQKKISMIHGREIDMIDDLREIDRKSDGIDTGEISKILKNLNSSQPIEIPKNASNFIDSINNDLIKLDEFIKKFQNKLASLTNLPHSTANEIQSLHKSSQGGGNETCLDDYKEELKKLFSKLIKLIDFENALKKLNESKKDAANNVENAKKILHLSETIDSDATTQQMALDIADEALRLAKEVERVEGAIYEKDSQLHPSGFEDALKKLFRKYDTSRYYRLLEELRDVTKKIDNSKGIDIDGYRRRIDNAIRYIENCNG